MTSLESTIHEPSLNYQREEFGPNPAPILRTLIGWLHMDACSIILAWVDVSNRSTLMRELGSIWETCGTQFVLGGQPKINNWRMTINYTRICKSYIYCYYILNSLSVWLQTPLLWATRLKTLMDSTIQPAFQRLPRSIEQKIICLSPKQPSRRILRFERPGFAVTLSMEIS